MALISLGMPVFSGAEDEDLELFINLYRGYLDSVNVNYQDRAANPPGVKRAMGILRSCMQGQAAIWFDREITGKNWKLNNINKNGTAVMNAFRQLVIPEGAGGPNAGTYIVGSPAANYAGVPANALLTIGQAFIPPDTALSGQEGRDASIMWRRCGAEPTTDLPNPLRNNNAGNGRPIVLESIHPSQVFYWMRERLPTLLEEKRKLRFSSLSQDDLPIREYYGKVVRAGQILGFTDEVINDQFFRGISNDNMLEIDRIGGEKPVRELVDTLERVERRKYAMQLGLSKKKAREAREANMFKHIEPIQLPSSSPQEPVVIKPVSQQGITQDMLNQILEKYTDNLTRNFHSQIQLLQEKIKQPVQIQTTLPSPQIKRSQAFGDTPLERVMSKINKQIEDRRKQREESELIDAFRNLKIDSGFIKAFRDNTAPNNSINSINSNEMGVEDYNEDDPMDTSNLTHIGDTWFDNEGNECTIQLVRKKKLIPN